MIDPNAPAYPAPDDYGQDGNPIYGPKAIHGMTIRATMAMHAMCGLLSSGHYTESDLSGNPDFTSDTDYDDEGERIEGTWRAMAARDAIRVADDLIAELNTIRKT